MKAWDFGISAMRRLSTLVSALLFQSRQLLLFSLQREELNQDIALIYNIN
jgi:hypothetical protein